VEKDKPKSLGELDDINVRHREPSTSCHAPVTCPSSDGLHAASISAFTVLSKNLVQKLDICLS